MDRITNAFEQVEESARDGLSLLDVGEDLKLGLGMQSFENLNYPGYNLPNYDSFILEEENSIFDFSTENDKEKQDQTTHSNETHSWNLSDKEKKPKNKSIDFFKDHIPIYDPIKQEDKIKANLLKTRLAKLNELCIEVTKLVNGQFDDLNLSFLDPIHFNLLKEMFVKKFKQDNNLDKIFNRIAGNPSNNQTTELKHCINTITTGKRKEEILKFCFKQTLTHLKRKMGIPYKGLKITDEISFWRHYFEKTSKEKGIPLDHFFDPLNSRRIKNSGYKNLNKAYLTLLFNDEEFKADFMKYLESEFKLNYQQKVLSKVKKMLLKVRKQLRNLKADNYDKVVIDFITKLRESKVFKFPWMDKEVDDAVISFKNYINKLKKF